MHQKERPFLITLSARTAAALAARIRQLYGWLEGDGAESSLGDTAYTLLVGRTHMAVRFTVVVRSLAELRQKLGEVLGAEPGAVSLPARPLSPADGRRLLAELSGSSDQSSDPYRAGLSDLGSAYVAGLDLPWADLYRQERRRRVSLPTYPHERERYWVPETAAATAAAPSGLHPLLDSNQSTLEQQCFAKELRETEFFMRDHQVGSDRVLPGAAHLEMARAAGEIAGGGRQVWQVRNVLWSVPIHIGATERARRVQISLIPTGTGPDEVDYVITGPDGELHSQGRLVYAAAPEAEAALDLAAIERSSTSRLTSAECVRLFAARNLQLGESFQALRELYCSSEQALARLQLPAVLAGAAQRFTLHPSLLDGALQSVIGLVEGTGATLSLPVGVDEITIYDRIPERCFAVATPDGTGSGDERRFTVRITDERGRVLVRVLGFRLKVLQASADLLYGRFRWVEASLPAERTAGGDLLLFGTAEQAEAARSHYKGGRLVAVIPGAGYKQVAADRYEIDPQNRADYQRLVADLQGAGIVPAQVLQLWFGAENRFFPALFLAGALAEAWAAARLRVLYVYPWQAGALNAAIDGFARSLVLEHPGWSAGTVGAEGAPEMVRLALAELAAGIPAVTVRYEHGQRLVRQAEEFTPAAAGSPLGFRSGGVYLITGGTGRLGMAVARAIRAEADAAVVLAGRSAPGPALQEQVAALGARALWLQADLSREGDVRRLVAEIKARFGGLTGIIHCAGQTRDALLVKKTAEDAGAVLAPKVQGTLYLDAATQDEPLEFFLLFSSVAAVSGNLGQCDYAFANAFLDSFAHERERLRSEGRRQGRTLSINWPLWAEGGLQVDEHTLTLFRNNYGMLPLDTATGIGALKQALACGEPQVVVARGDRAKLRKMLAMTIGAETPRAAAVAADPAGLSHAVARTLVQLVTETIKVREHEITLQQAMSDYGFNSITLTDFMNRVNARYGLALTPAIFFEHPNLGSLARFLATTYPTELERIHQQVVQPAAATPEVAAPGATPAGRRFLTTAPAAVAPVAEEEEEPIAIVGMSGIFPGSDSLEGFWQDLIARRNLITEVPADRWDWRAYYSESGEGINKTAARWGGFLHEVDKFDNAFFGISPREAELMDPQQRIFLETVWGCMEDAGYAPGALAGSRTGLFVGVSTSDYYDLMKENGVPIEPHVSTGLSHCVLANRISYLFDFHGPSEPIDTACSSSLIAIHRAVESIRRQDCDMAIAGGINVMVSPMLFIAFGKAGMLSPDGSCKTFDRRANGYVRGEGAGAVLLKRLSRALADGDHIYALVRGTAVNHGGHANTLTTPNPNAQEELLVRAYARAGFDPSTVGYIEAHGTGTALGDPVEINGLKKAFGKLYEQWSIRPPMQPHCGLSSVKTNIGHLEAAAGIAGVIKVLLAMKHRQLPGTVHFQEQNPYIQLEGCPFYIVDQTQPWQAIRDAAGRELPRRAGVSSFGFGGANAHVVLEEYPAAQCEAQPGTAGAPQLAVLSARNAERLKANAAQLVAFLRSGKGRGDGDRPAALRAELAGLLAQVLGLPADELSHTEQFTEFGLDGCGQAQFADLVAAQFGVAPGGWSDAPNLTALAERLAGSAGLTSGVGLPALADVAYTLQVGRQAMEERLAVVVHSVAELADVLDRFARGEKVGVCGSVKRNAAPGEQWADQVRSAMAEPDLVGLAQLWVQGAPVDWAALHADRQARRLALPTYRFERRRHWMARADARPQPQPQPQPQVKPQPAGLPVAVEPVTPYTGDEVTLEILDGSIALVTLRDVVNRNMFSDGIINGLISRFDTIAKDDRIKAIVVTGYENVFCMGGTREQLLAIADNRAKFTDVPFLFTGLLKAPVPVIAAMQGHASGGGMLFGLYADIVVMSLESIYSAVFTKYGFTPGMGATYVLKQKLGDTLATEMMYTARSYKGEELQQRGAPVIFRPRSDVLSEALAMARTLAEKPAHTLQVLKRELSRRALAELPEYVEREAQMHAETFSHPETVERIQYFFARGEEKGAAPARAAAAAEHVAVTVRAEPGPEEVPSAGPAQTEAVLERLVDIFCAYLHTTPQDLEVEASFKDLGIDSINGVEIIREINGAFGLNLDAVALYENPTLLQLAAMVAGRVPAFGAPIEARQAATGKLVLAKRPPAPTPTPTPTAAPARSRVALEEVRTRIADILCHLLHMEPAELEDERSFKDLGIDSINGVEIIREINAAFRLNLDAVVLYECATTVALADRIAQLLDQQAPHQAPRPEPAQPTQAALPPQPIRLAQPAPHEPAQPHAPIRLTQPAPHEPVAPASTQRTKLALKAAPAVAEPVPVAPVSPAQAVPVLPAARPTDDGVAIIGMSGRFPGADTLAAFWSNLAGGVDSITEIPADRWNADEFYAADPQAPGKTNSRHGGFLSDVDKFDPLFFHITPAEAEIMDPQQRLFLEESWKALEDAGYSEKALAGKRCGVFVGATHGDYRKLLMPAGLDNHALAFTGLNPFILSGRVSYVLNLTGPNLTLDTACSSSLVALHLACQSIRNGECDMALAGGVRITLTPDLHIQTGQMGLLSPTGQCRSFDRNADGLILSEGVGVIVLKSLRQAIAGRDHIYGVVRGSGVNQDGRSNGIAAPSVPAQVSLETELYRRYQINPEQISYIEGNGTGTTLGDSIEIKALKESFGAFTDKRHFCRLGTVKSNIGHATMASGIAGVIKVLLAMQHRQLPPSLHFEAASPLAQIEESPFYVGTDLADWNPSDGGPRMAAINSFGLSGTNCHVVISEWNQPAVQAQAGSAPCYLIPLSARTAGALQQRLRDLSVWLKEEGRPESVGDVAFTLACGRSHFPVRCALLARDMAELTQAVADALAGMQSPLWLSSSAAGDRPRQDPLLKELERHLLSELSARPAGEEQPYRERLAALADLYVKGYPVDWLRFFAPEERRRVPLPTYPFARERYWVPETSTAASLEPGAGATLHPLVHRNSSSLREQRFTSVFTGQEFFLADHRVNRQRVLPGVALLEMARTAGVLAAEQPVTGLRNVIWAAPVSAGTDGTAQQEVHVSVYPVDETLQFEVYSRRADERVIHGQGRLLLQREGALNGLRLDPADIERRCDQSISGAEYYARFQGDGLFLGESFRSIEHLHCGKDEALAVLRLPPACAKSGADYTLHPALIDGVVETVIGLVRSRDESAVYMPFALGELQILGSVPEHCYAYAIARDAGQSEADLQKFDMVLADANGQAVVMFREFAVRSVGGHGRTGATAPDTSLLTLLKRLGAGELKAADVEQYLGVNNRG